MSVSIKGIAGKASNQSQDQLTRTAAKGKGKDKKSTLTASYMPNNSKEFLANSDSEEDSTIITSVQTCPSKRINYRAITATTYVTAT